MHGQSWTLKTIIASQAATFEAGQQLRRFEPFIYTPTKQKLLTAASPTDRTTLSFPKVQPLGLLRRLAEFAIDGSSGDPPLTAACDIRRFYIGTVPAMPMGTAGRHRGLATHRYRLGHRLRLSGSIGLFIQPTGAFEREER